MLTSMPTRLLPSNRAHPANAAPWLESTPHDLDARRSPFIHTEDAPLNGPVGLTVIPFRAQSATSVHDEQLSIPIHPPR
jgi:hypothetical protein